MDKIVENILQMRERILAAEQKYRRPGGSVRLVAVSKAQPVEAVRQAARAGQVDFGENYVQEALTKIRELKREGLVWHFIGPVQSNKTGIIAENFSWVHCIDRERTARRLSAARPAGMPPINICIQVNISGETSKSGVAPDEAGEFSDLVASLPAMKLRGVMVIPAPSHDFTEQRRMFNRAAELLKRLNTDRGHALDTLSMGMSDDFEAAIAEGATMVRIGTAIFGPRQS